jgi:hypothetical protein
MGAGIVIKSHSPISVAPGQAKAIGSQIYLSNESRRASEKFSVRGINSERIDPEAHGHSAENALNYR